MVDDPTVLELQALGARMFGKEDALFVPSGTMSNLICCMIHADSRGSELIVGDESHIHIYEQGNVSQFGGIHPRAIPTMPDGTLPLDALERAIRPVGDDHLPLTRAICLETTHNRCGGRVLSPQYIQSVVQLAQKHNIKVHIDGARIFNAIRVLGISPAEYTSGVDSLSVCLSKGLAAPVGSLIVGSKDFCRRARRIRKAIGTLLF
jgi:threonine aldolase